MRKKHRFLLVGCGGISHAWLKEIRAHFADRVEPVGFVDIYEANARAIAEKFYPGVNLPIYGSLETALAETQPDVVFNCTIPGAHAATCEAALRAKCDVLVEKPLAPTVAEGRKLVALAEEMGRQLVVIQNRRYEAGLTTVKRALEDGVIGRVHTLHADFFTAPRFGGFRETMAHPLLLDMAIHTFDQARVLSGLNPVQVSCREFNPRGSWFAQGASAVALFEMEDSALFSYRGSWCAQGHQTSWHAAWRIIGETGTLLWDGERSIVVERVCPPWDGKVFLAPVERCEIPLIPLDEAQTNHAGNIGEFLDAIEEGRQAQTSAKDNLHSLVMVEGAVQSAEERGASVVLESFFR